MLIKQESQPQLVNYVSVLNRCIKQEDDGMCKICGNNHDGCHFGVISCRACSAFYRRSIIENRQYICKAGDDQCPIQNVEQRKICRSCRMKRCQELGMKKTAVQIYRDPLGKNRRMSSDGSDTNTDSPSSSSSSAQSPERLEEQVSLFDEWNEIPSTSIALIENPRNKRPMLSYLSDGIANWNQSQKYLHALLFPKFGTEMRFAPFNETLITEKASIGLITQMLDDFFPSYRALPVTIKSSIMPKFVQFFRMIERSVQNERLFGMNNNKSYVHFGQYIDKNNLKYYFRDQKNPEAAAKITEEVIVKCRPLTSKIEALKLRDVEYVALSAILLWNFVNDQEQTDNDCFEVIRDRIFAELHEDLIEEYGERLTPTRQMELAHLLSITNVVCNELDILNTQCKFFDVYDPNIWENWN